MNSLVTVQIRRAVQADALAVAHVHVRAWRVAYRGLINQGHLDGLRVEDRAGRYTFEDPNPDGPHTQVAVDNGAICGLVTTGRSRDADTGGDGELLALYVDPPRWAAGFGRALITAGRTELRDNGFNAAGLWVLAANTRARRFYQHDGWEADGAQRREVIGGRAVTEVRYRRRL